MSLWGASTSDESKPKHLTTAEKKQVFATTAGWVRESGNENSGNDNTAADPEVLVAIGGLTTLLGAATITSCEFITTSWDASAGGTLQCRVRWNEAVDVVVGGSSLKLNVNRTPDGGSAASHTLVYASGTGTNELVFSLAIAGGSPVAALDSFAITDQGLAFGGGTTLKDAGTATASEFAITVAQASAAGTLVAVA
jgi:hypothetical protein